MAQKMASPAATAYVFGFERDFDVEEVRQWVNSCWLKVVPISCLIYLVVIFGIQRLMTNKARFELRKALFFWNGGLALFSIVGAARTIPEFWDTLNNQGFYDAVCTSRGWTAAPSGFWSAMFVFSKLPEFGDTLFIVLRKQKLIFLHWYHHMSVVYITWYSLTEHAAPSRWGIVINYSIHSVMYTYFALKAIRVRIPNAFACVITSLQTTQFVITTCVMIWSLEYKRAGLPCQISYGNASVVLFVSCSYLALFAHFFYQKYIVGGTPAVKTKAP